MKESDVKYIPCSGLAGENLIKSSDVKAFTGWYSGQTLLEVIGKLHRHVGIPMDDIVVIGMCT